MECLLYTGVRHVSGLGGSVCAEADAYAAEGFIRSHHNRLVFKNQMDLAVGVKHQVSLMLSSRDNIQYVLLR